MKILLIGDIHAGSTVAPWPEGAPLSDDAGTWHPGKAQRWLNRSWQTMIEECRHEGPFDVIIEMGDVIDGDNPRSGQRVTNRLDYQAGAAVELLSPVRDLTKRFYMVRGTEWHVGKMSQWCTHVAEQLDATAMPNNAGRIWPELFLEIETGVLHALHHISSSSNPMYEATALTKELIALRADLQRAWGQSAAPDVRVIVRAHRHRFFAIEDSAGWRALTIPPWQLKTSYAYARATWSVSQIGYVILRSDSHGVDDTARLFRLPRARIE